MFNSIRGRLSEQRADAICLECNGVEWELSVPSRAIAAFGPLGSEVRAFTWLHHYEDGMRLFAFPSAEERSLFLELLKVDGIGPNKALHVLSGIAPDALATALEREDLATLQRIPGVGPKVAQKMVLALKGRLVSLAAPSAQPRSAPKAWADLTKALVDMGFDRREVERVVAEVAAAQGADAKGGEADEREIFRLALVELSSGS